METGTNKPTAYQITLPNGLVATRKSKNTYTAVVLATTTARTVAWYAEHKGEVKVEGRQGVCSWHGSPELAEKAANILRKRFGNERGYAMTVLCGVVVAPPKSRPAA